MGDWTFVTNHAMVLLCINRDPGLRIRDVAAQVGITERAAQRIVNDLVEAGYVRRSRVGNRNVYTIYPQLPFRVSLLRHREIGGLLELLEERAGSSALSPRSDEANDPPSRPDVASDGG